MEHYGASDMPRQGGIPVPALTGGGDRAFDLLLLEDSRFDAQAVARTCQRTDLPINVTVAPDIAAYGAAIVRRRFDLVMLDYLLPDGDGLAAVSMLRGSSRNARSPSVMISGAARHDVAVAAMKSGCMDYVAKDGLTAETMRDLVLRADTAMARQPVEPGADDGMMAAFRSVLREELAMVGVEGRGPLDAEVLGLIDAEDSHIDWATTLAEEDRTIVFRTRNH